MKRGPYPKCGESCVYYFSDWKHQSCYNRLFFRPNWHIILIVHHRNSDIGIGNHPVESLKKKRNIFHTYIQTLVQCHRTISQERFVEQSLKIHPVITNVFRKPNLHQRRHLFTINSPHDTLLAVTIFVVKDSLKCRLLTARSFQALEICFSVSYQLCSFWKIKGPLHIESKYILDVKKFI